MRLIYQSMEINLSGFYNTPSRQVLMMALDYGNILSSNMC